LATGRARETQTANEDPQLSEALANLVAGLFAHIEALEQAVATLDARIGTACEPNAELVELLFTIPGVRVNTARVLIAECGVDMSVFPSALQTNSCRARTTDSHFRGGKSLPVDDACFSAMDALLWLSPTGSSSTQDSSPRAVRAAEHRSAAAGIDAASPVSLAHERSTTPKGRP